MKLKTFLFFTILLVSCKQPTGNLSPQKITFQEEMRLLVQNLSKNAKAIKANFIVIPQNGLELLKTNSIPNSSYLQSIDGIGAESIYFGYNVVDQENTKADVNFFESYLNEITIGTKPVFAVDYCGTNEVINRSILINKAKNNKLYITNNKSLSELPNPNVPLLGENKSNIEKLQDAKNFMLMANLDNYPKETLIESIANTNFDIVVVNCFYKNDLLNAKDIIALKTKKNGGKRLVLAQIDVSIADSKKYYWVADWKLNLPQFVNKQMDIDGTKFRANYWQEEWQNILSGNENSIISNFIKLDFNGTYLTGNEAFVFYE